MNPIYGMFNGNFKRYSLYNGLSVALQNHPGLTTSIRLTILHARVHENKGEEGIGHFVEHKIMVDGSKKRTAEEADVIRAKFGYHIPEVDVDWVSIPIGVIPNRLEIALDYLSDVPFNPRFDVSRVESQRGRILREIADEKSMPDFEDKQDYHDALFGDHPCNLSIHGREEVVRSVTIDDLRSFHARGYHPNNTRLIVAGPLPSNIEAIIERYFGNISPGYSTDFQFPSIRPLPDKVLLYRDAQELHDHDYPEDTKADLRLGIIVPPFLSQVGSALELLAHSLISYTDSRLFKVISDRDGLAYEIEGGYLGSFNRGFIEIKGPVRARQVERVIDTIFREMARLRTEPISRTELDTLTDDLYYRTLRKLEHSSGSAHLIEGVFETGITPDEWFRRISAVTPEQIREVAERHLPNDRETGKYVLLVRNPILP
ncbi:insulinase family protein [Candidatus Woesearchaeota archaeon]|nr:insulinase family protein [Candidatus Woesearchaeota archaeon]